MYLNKENEKYAYAFLINYEFSKHRMILRIKCIPYLPRFVFEYMTECEVILFSYFVHAK